MNLEQLQNYAAREARNETKQQRKALPNKEDTERNEQHNETYSVFHSYTDKDNA